MKAESTRAGVSNEGAGETGEPEHSAVSSPRAGLRDKEREWCRAHADELRSLSGEWVILQGERVVGHGKEPAALITEARRQGIKIPYIFYVGEVDQNSATLGL
jgi:Family of unknown function (DUF5678)